MADSQMAAIVAPPKQNETLANFLADSVSGEASVTTIDFDDSGFPEYKSHFAILIENLFSKSECQALVEGAEQSTGHRWQSATINAGNGQQFLDTHMRLCDRIVWSDQKVAAQVLNRIMPFLPEDIITMTNKPCITGEWSVKRKESWKISRLNEHLRFLRYTRGMYFRTHCDGKYVTPDEEETSFLTLHLYLNGDEAPPAEQWGAEKDQDKPLLGGTTRFVGLDDERSLDIDPRAGSVLVFQQRNLMHGGMDVRQGTKYTMRSDILYHKVEV